MEIQKQNTGPHGKTIKYVVYSSSSELARYDTLDEASLVLRYLTGANMTADDAAEAREAIKKADAPAVQTKGTR